MQGPLRDETLVAHACFALLRTMNRRDEVSQFRESLAHSPTDLRSLRASALDYALKLLAAHPRIPLFLVGQRSAAVAERLHGLTHDSELAPFVRADCVWLPGDATIALFGIGERAERTGLVGRALNGTLLLENVEALAHVDQMRLEQLIDEGDFRPVGSTRKISASLRLVLASTYEPSTLLRMAKLRRALVERLSSLIMHVP